MELEKELQELVSKHLPQATGDALRKRLDQADKDSKDLSDAKAALAVERGTIKELQVIIQEFRDLKLRQENIEKGEKDLASNQRNLEIEKLQYQLACEKSKTDMAVTLNLSLTRNTIFKTSIFDSENQQGYQGQNGQWIQPMPTNKSHIKTKNAE